MFSALRGPTPALVGGIALSFSGGSTYWDIATHIDGGRERFLTPPHIGIYSGVTVALAVIGLAMLSDRFARGASLRDALLHPFRGVRPGLSAAGTGMATALVAAPIDNAWHEIYGIDITIWSPPHLLAILGVSASALGLAMLVAPPSLQHRPVLHFFLLSAFLGGLVITTGEFEFNAPQYRIAYHPMILSAAATLVFVAAARGPLRWSATIVAVFFELTRLASWYVLAELGHSLPFVPLLLPAAFAADLLRRRIPHRPAATGAALGAITVATNAAFLEVSNTITWRGSDLAYGAVGALLLSALAGLAGGRLGAVLAGEHGTKPARRKARAATLLIAAALWPSSALAHEVGGDAGVGVISWEPAVAAPGEEVIVEIRDLEITSGADVDRLRVEAWRAQHRLAIPLTRQGRDGVGGELRLPQEGPWMLLIRVEAGDQSLLATRQLQVDASRAPPGGRNIERFTVGLDTLRGSDVPRWIDAVAYLVTLAVLVLLVTGLLRSLARLSASPSVHARNA